MPHSEPEDVAEAIKHDFDHYPENTRIRVKDGRVEVSTYKEKEKYRSILRTCLEEGEVAALSWVSNTTDTGVVKVKRKHNGTIITEKKFSEEGRHFGEEAAAKFYRVHNFQPQMRRFQVEYYNCFTCEEYIKAEGYHTHEGQGIGVDFDSDEYNIIEVCIFDEASKMGDEISPKAYAMVVDSDGVCLKMYGGKRGGGFHQHFSKASGFINALEHIC